MTKDTPPPRLWTLAEVEQWLRDNMHGNPQDILSSYKISLVDLDNGAIRIGANDTILNWQSNMLHKIIYVGSQRYRYSVRKIFGYLHGEDRSKIAYVLQKAPGRYEHMTQADAMLRTDFDTPFVGAVASPRYTDPAPVTANKVRALACYYFLREGSITSLKNYSSFLTGLKMACTWIQCAADTSDSDSHSVDDGEGKSVAGTQGTQTKNLKHPREESEDTDPLDRAVKRYLAYTGLDKMEWQHRDEYMALLETVNTQRDEIGVLRARAETSEQDNITIGKGSDELRNDPNAAEVGVTIVAGVRVTDSEISRLATIIDTQKQEIAALQARADTAEQDKVIQSEECTELRRKLAESQEEARAATAESQRLEGIMSSDKQDTASLQSRIETAVQDLDTKTGECSTLQHLLNESREETRRLGITIAAQDQVLTTLRDDKATKDQECDKLECRLADAQNEVQVAKAETTTEKESRKTMQKELDKAQRDGFQLYQKLRDAEKSLAERPQVGEAARVIKVESNEVIKIEDD